MNVLIIEDIEEKARAVKSLLETYEDPRLSKIAHAKSVATGRRELEKCQYDLLILDLMLPIRDFGTPQGNGGADLLEELVSGDTLLKPTHIICLTEYDNLAESLESDVHRSLVHSINFDGNEGTWRTALNTKIAYIRHRLKVLAAAPLPYAADVAIVTSSPPVELSEVLHGGKPFVAEFHREDALHYYLAEWQHTSGRPLKVVACAAPQMGMTAACITTSKVVNRWRPRFIAMSGIAAGTKKDLKFGDILIGETIFDYGSGKIVDSRNGKRIFVPDPRPLTIDAELKAVLQKCEREQLYVRDFMQEWRGAKVDWIPSIHLSVLASGAAVIQSKTVVEEILKTSRKVVGLEMEAYGVFHAAMLCREPRPRVLIAKSVADFADIRKSDDWQQFAAFTSFQFIKSFFTSCADLFGV